MRAFLRSSEECFQLKHRRTTIGRHEGSDIVLKVRVSMPWACGGAEEHHAALEFTGWESGFVLQDLNSPQGTFVNGCQVQNAAVHVGPGDILRFGAQGASFELMVDGVSQDEKLLSLEKEIGRLSAFEAESKQKDTVIRDLQGELASMAKSMAAVRNDVELTQRLLTFEGEVRAKTEEIKALKEQISSLQKGSSEIFSHSLRERDLEMGSLRRESEKLKRDHALTTGLVTSLQREIAVKEQKIQQLKQEVEKTKQANREKDNQLAAVSAKCSRIKEEMKRELGEREMAAYQKRIGELECELKGLQEEVQKYHSEQKAIQTQLAEKAKVEEELKSTCKRKSLQLQEMGRRERLLKSDVDRAQGQLESFKSQVMRVCSPQAAGESGKALTVQQAFLRASFCSSSLKSELSKLEAMLVDPLVLDIHAAVVEITRVVLSWLEGAEQLLASTGLELPTSKKGLTACLKRLLEKYQETERRNEMLQAQLEEVQESRDALLQERLEELKAKHEQDLQIKINQIILEKEEEKTKILESTVLKEKEKHKQCLDEEKKRIQDLESHLRSMAEMMLKQQALMQDEQLKILQDESEVLKRKTQEEIAEYKEQIKQHSRTIVALEDRLLEAEQQQKALKEENVVLEERIKGLQDDACRSTSGASQEVKESHCCGLEELAAMQSILQAKEAAIVGLTKELSETRARMSDMRGELSEKQKADLEQSLHRVKSQECELGVLRGKLSGMSDLVAKKDRELQAAAAELRKVQDDCKALKDASQRMAEELEMPLQAQAIPATPEESSEQYLDFICALGRLMNMKELEGMQPMEHLPQEEREKVGQQRWRDLGLLYERISKLKDRLERKEERLRECETSIEQLRLNQESLQTCQEEMLRLEDEVYRGAEEKALLREALERTKAELGQEKRLNRAARQRKSLAENGEKRKEKELPNRVRSSKGRGGKVLGSAAVL
ncbi:hypothetical protein CIB84_001349 [Bambusicola thoracicus]|uniref:FHA domain-containing protein n=1 Tax=Bambusicola thoracicus TaxID=9083 RepID=A0A2P4TEU1_BAMTH|nr:hypothetical protein CIB84_001349 [Bambusicola thoracicus]